MAADAAMGGGLSSGFELAGRYRIGCELGRGGMGVVYEAKHLALGHDVALKTLHPRLLEDQEAVARFIREARSAASIGHPGIVHVFDLATDQGVTFLAMERLRGEDLRQRLERAGALPIPRVIALGRELAQAIAAAHQRGVLHRDLTPRNVFLAIDALGHECVKVLDFGIAKLTESLPNEGVTQSQQTFGTLMYMPPERVAGAPADARVDVYAIGALMYEALTGSPPFAVCPYGELALKIALESPVRLRALRPDTPAPLIAVIERAMHKDPRKRWPSAQELTSALLALDPKLPDRSDQHAEPTKTASLRAPLLGGRRGALLIVTASVLLLAGLTSATWPRPPVPHAVRAGPSAAAADRRIAAPPPTMTHAVRSEAPAQPSLPLRAESVAAPLRQDVLVVAHPKGASVAINDGPSCRTPCRLEVPLQGTAILRARLVGYRPIDRPIVGSPPPEIELWLRPSKTAVASAEPASPVLAPLPPLLPRR